MKSSIKIAAVAFFALGLSAYADEGFLRPEVSYAMPSNSVAGLGDLQGAIAFDLAAGATFGAQGEQEGSLSVGTASFKASQGPVSVKVREIPVLLNYRLSSGARGDSVRYYAGLSTGGISARATTTMPGFSDSQSKFPWAFGLDVGAAFKLADRVNLDLGYRFLYSTRISEWDVNLKTSYFYASADYRF